MAQSLPNFLGPLNDFWKRLTIGQKAGLVLSATLILTMAVLLVTWTSKSPYVALYSELSGKDAAKIADVLRENKVPYRLSDGGSQILVPQNTVYEQRLHFAGLNLPSSGELGYELFDKPMLGMSEFMQRMNYHRALEGELSRTIGELEEIESARVHLVLPAPTLFEEDKKPPTASIVLRLNPNAKPTQKQIQGISYLIAYAVEGLDVENITIVDALGNLLSSSSGSSTAAGLTSTQLEVQYEMEKALTDKAKALLDDVVGPGKSQVKVSAKLNWNRTEKTIESYDNEAIAIRSEERQELSGATTEERSVTNYEVPRTVETIIPEVGNIERLSVSILVDGTYITTTNDDGTESHEFVDRTPAELNKFTTLVKSAVGFNEQRQDQISIVSFPFERFEEPVPTGNPEFQQRFLLRVLEKVILGLIIIGIFFLARSLLRKLSGTLPRLPSMEPNPAQLSGAPSTAGLPPGRSSSSASQDMQTSATETIDTPDGPRVIFKQKGPSTIEIEDAEISEETLKRAELTKRASKFIEEKPEQATQLFRSWLIEDRSHEFENR
ncbi:flagellar M-ring protein FliF [bacterium]|nr:flagellar M-ring protein FliF [bacterium]